MAALADVTPRGFCGWTKYDKYGVAFPCDKPSYRRLVDGPELWEGEFCRYHAPRALKRAIEEERRAAEGW